MVPKELFKITRTVPKSKALVGFGGYNPQILYVHRLLREPVFKRKLVHVSGIGHNPFFPYIKYSKRHKKL